MDMLMVCVQIEFVKRESNLYQLEESLALGSLLKYVDDTFII